MQNDFQRLQRETDGCELMRSFTQKMNQTSIRLKKMPLRTSLCARTGHDDCQIGHERTIRYHIENILPSFVSALMMISPFTLRFLRLCRSDKNN